MIRWNLFQWLRYVGELHEVVEDNALGIMGIIHQVVNKQYH